MTEVVFDPGLQPERTVLAWRRTILSAATASFIVARFALDHSWLVAAGIAVCLCLAGWVIVERRQRVSLGRLLQGRPVLPAGAAVAICTAATSSLGVCGILWLVLRVMTRPGG